MWREEAEVKEAGQSGFKEITEECSLLSSHLSLGALSFQGSSAYKLFLRDPIFKVRYGNQNK